MKRKLFTLLAAFMALATFQSNAQGTAPYDGQTLHYLNVWTADQEKTLNDAFIDANYGVSSRGELAKDYPLSADKADSSTGLTGKPVVAMKYVKNVQFDKWELTNSNRIGVVGDVDTYFTLTSGTGDQTNTYTIKSASPSAKGDVIKFTGNNGVEYKNFVFLRFVDDNGDEYDGLNTTGNVTAVKDSVGMVPWTVKYSLPRQGGYLAANIFTGRNQGGINDRSLYVVAYDTTLNLNGAPHERYAIYSMDEVRNNWNQYFNYKRTGNGAVTRIVPVWVKADAVGGRWATVNDFPDEFIQLRIQENNTATGLFTVGGINTFSVAQVGVLDFGANGSDPAVKPAGAHTDALGDNPAASPAAGETSRLYSNGSTWELQYFTIANPCNGQLLQVNRDQVPNNPLLTGEGQFGNKLTFNNWYTAVSNAYPGATVDELQRTQQFAIWINENGNMELYPLNSWTYMTSQAAYKTTAPTSPGFNYAVWMDRPYATTTNSNVDNFNNSFKIGQMSGTYCTGPVSGVHTGYSNLDLRPEKANLINKIDKKRYYFIQVKPRAFGAYYGSAAANRVNFTANQTFVLDLVRDGDNKRVVLTEMESERYTAGGDRYFDTPYDSVNMSAHWRFEAVKGGYNIINELNDTLEYSYANFAALTDPEAAYIADKNPSGGYKSDVWQTVHLNCFGEGYFKLRNMAESTTERPVISRPYLDTLWTANTATARLWYQSGRGLQATTTTAYPYLNHLQKDVTLNAGNIGSAGLLFALRAIDYEYPVGGNDNNKTNHTDDGYLPADDSLCTYLYKQGNYDIVEALGNPRQGRIEGSYATPADLVFGKNLAWMGAYKSEDPWLFVEPVFNAENKDLTQFKYLIPTDFVHPTLGRIPNVDYMLTPDQMADLKDFSLKSPFPNPSKEFVDLLKSEGLTLDVYKWHYIKNAQGDYLVYDTINTTTTVSQQQFGFKFVKTDRNNATPFRFYQPLVGDKSRENFIMEFRVNKHDYTFDRQGAVATGSYKWSNGYDTDNYGINPLLWTSNSADDALYAVNATNVSSRANILATLDAWNAKNWNSADMQPDRVLELLKYLQSEHVARTKYVILSTSSSLLVSTWNDGHDKTSGIQAATRFRFRGPDQADCPRDYYNSKYLIDKQIYANPTVKANMMDVSVNPSVATNDFIGTKADGYADNNPTALNLYITLADTLKAYTPTAYYGNITNAANRMQNPNTNGLGYIKMFRQEYNANNGTVNTANDAKYNRYRQYENTTDVELYYIQNAKDTTLYLTVDTSSIYSQTIGGTLNGVSGVKLLWKKKFGSASQNGSTVGEVTDYRPLQMFAIYGCKNDQSPFGNFILIPAASWEVNYTSPQKQTQILPNVKIGNGTVTDEFRISEAWTQGSQGSNYMIVMPSSQNAPQGVTPTEYTFLRDPYYVDEYFCTKTNGDKHSFVQRQAFQPSAALQGNYVYSYKVGAANSTKNYYDPSMHWSICKVANTNNLFTFTPESDKWDANGDKVPSRNQLSRNYYLVPLKETTNEYGQKSVVFNAIPQYEPSRDSLLTLTLTRMSETPGDACITAFKKFAEDDLLLDWGVLESIRTDRYIYSKGKADASGYVAEAAAAFYGQVGVDGDKVQYLRLRESNTVCDADHHCIPYYNIIHVVVDPITKLEKEFYLELTENTVRFRSLTADEARVVTNFEKYPADTMQAVKFCFPFRTDADGKDSTTVNLNGTAYRDVNVAIRTMPQHNQIYWLAVNTGNTTQTKSVKNAEEADVFFFGPNADSDEEWIGSADKEGWLKDFSRSSVYVVEPSGASDVNYGLLSFTSDVKPTIDDGKFKFTLVYDSIVNKYAKTKVWFYSIQDQAGKFLTYAPETLGSKFHYGDYTYAYFTEKQTVGSRQVSNQLFGLQINKAAATTGHGFPFWIVSHVPSGEYKYLGQYNSRMVFIPSTSASKAVAQAKAMTFEIGKVSGGNFTKNPDVAGNALAVYGVEGAVKVVNAEGVIELYTIDGRQFKSVVATNGEQTITAPRGVIIVKNAGKAVKVVVK
ncbi:hypothetical protein FACS1894155_01920 [Bacteroidia bacterium]|nr:hypothetical protein FACS1894155_01920 [Bacteroidia bacterium]